MMLKKVIILSLVIILAVSNIHMVLAEGTAIDYSGSVEVDGVTQTTNNDFLLGSDLLADYHSFGSYTKWQNDLRIIPNDQVTLKFRVSYLNDTAQPETENDQFVLSRGFIDFTPNNFLSFRFGKQRLGWGTGYAWNPSDILDQPRNAFTDIDDPEGVTALRTDLNLGPVTTQLVIVTDSEQQDWSSSGRALRFKASPGGVDISIGAVQNGDQSTATIADIAASVSGIGLHGEALYQPDGYTPSGKKNILNYLIGIDYNFPGGYYLALEYYRNDQAFKDIDEFTTYLGTKQAEMITHPVTTPQGMQEMAVFQQYVMEYLTDSGNNGGVIRDHYFLHGMKKFGDNFTFDLMLVYCPVDNSLVGQPEFDYIWGQNTRLFVKALLATGDSKSEANLLPAKNSWKIGMKVNF